MASTHWQTQEFCITCCVIKLLYVKAKHFLLYATYSQRKATNPPCGLWTTIFLKKNFSQQAAIQVPINHKCCDDLGSESAVFGPVRNGHVFCICIHLLSDYLCRVLCWQDLDLSCILQEISNSWGRDSQIVHNLNFMFLPSCQMLESRCCLHFIQPCNWEAIEFDHV